MSIEVPSLRTTRWNAPVEIIPSAGLREEGGFLKAPAARVKSDNFRGRALLVLLCPVVFLQCAAAPPPPAAAIEPPAGVGLRVQPPVMWIPDVTPGAEMHLPAPITVENTGSRTISFSIDPIAASSLGMRSMPGYADIPDPSWFKAEMSAVTLAPGQAKSIALKLLVPEGPCYYNRHWCVAFSIQSTDGGAIGAAAYPYAYVETVSLTGPIRPPEPTGSARSQAPAPPRGTGAGSTSPTSAPAEPAGERGCLMVAPGIVDVGDVPLGTRSEPRYISVLNAHDRDISLSVTCVVPEPGRSAGNVLITPGHMWMKDTDWIEPSVECLRVPAGQEASFAVTVTGPADPAAANYRWEGFVALGCSDGRQFVVRVRWRTTEDAGKRDLLSRPPGSRP